MILRDILFSDKSHFREFLNSNERIASNVLSSHLEKLLNNGMLIKDIDPGNRSAAIYRPTTKTLDLLPALIELMRWGSQYNASTDMGEHLELRIQADPKGLEEEIRAKFVNAAS